MTHRLLEQLATGQPMWQAVGFFIGTFILEDVATVGAGLLLAAGTVSWATAFWPCFLGIWFGDAGLYGLARFAGRGWFEKSKLRRFAGKVARSERWFAKRGIPILIFSRILPGARLPTYLAAGFLRLPVGRFISVTGLASLIWTMAVLLVSRIIGNGLIQWLDGFKHLGWAICGILLLAWVLASLGRRYLTALNRKRLAAKAGRWLRWEFLPGWLFYPPVALYCLWLAIKYRGLMLPTAANPGICTGGIVGESKHATLRDLTATSPEFTAECELLTGSNPKERFRSLQQIRQRLEICYPFILKPDVGQRGAGVKLIRSAEQAQQYLDQTSAPLLVQRYAPGPCEAGVFYYRFPHESRGHIFAITAKLFPFITGDGSSTISELIWRDERARFVASKYLARLKGREDEVLPMGERLKLVQAGNHAEGCIFSDGMHLSSPALAEAIDTISRRLNGFFIGRYDLRYGSDEDLRAGRRFQIIELNGAASEATSIYDARNSLFDAYRTLFKQWDLVFAIGAANRANGYASSRLLEVWQKWREYSHVSLSYPAAD